MTLEPKTREAKIFIGNASESEMWGQVPSHTQDAIVAYLNRDGPPIPGSFLYAVLTNDLRLAVLKADRLNRERLPEIVGSLFSYAPASTWGSHEAIKTFLADGKEEG